MIPGISYNQLLTDLKLMRYFMDMILEAESFRKFDFESETRHEITELEELLERTKYCEDINK